MQENNNNEQPSLESLFKITDAKELKEKLDKIPEDQRKVLLNSSVVSSIKKEELIVDDVFFRRYSRTKETLLTKAIDEKDIARFDVLVQAGASLQVPKITKIDHNSISGVDVDINGDFIDRYSSNESRQFGFRMSKYSVQYPRELVIENQKISERIAKNRKVNHHNEPDWQALEKMKNKILTDEKSVPYRIAAGALASAGQSKSAGQSEELAQAFESAGLTFSNEELGRLSQTCKTAANARNWGDQFTITPQLEDTSAVSQFLNGLYATASSMYSLILKTGQSQETFVQRVEEDRARHGFNEMDASFFRNF